MGKPAARLTDMHVCPMFDGPKPHVGGPIAGPGCPTVLIAGLPAAVMGDMCVCVGPPDTIVLGSAGVMIGGKPAARMGDTCAHGGAIVLGCPTVLIGEVSPGSAPVVGGGASVAASGGGGGGLAAMPTNVIKSVIAVVPPDVAVKLGQAVSLKEAAINGAPLVHNPACCDKCLAKT